MTNTDVSVTTSTSPDGSANNIQLIGAQVGDQYYEFTQEDKDFLTPIMHEYILCDCDAPKLCSDEFSEAVANLVQQKLNTA